MLCNAKPDADINRSDGTVGARPRLKTQRPLRQIRAADMWGVFGRSQPMSFVPNRRTAGNERRHTMDINFLVPLLFLITLSAVMIFAVVSKMRVEQRMDDDNVPKSSLAADSKQK